MFKKHEGRNNWYAGQFFFCELLNLGNVAGNIYLVDWFLSGSFLDYGRLVVQVSLIGLSSPPSSHQLPQWQVVYRLEI